MSFAVAIILLRKAVSYRRLTITLAQTCGFVTFLAFAYDGFGSVGSNSAYQSVQGMLNQSATIYVLDTELQMMIKKAIAITVFGVWTVLAIYRLMRLELQYRNWPWAWTAFVVFMLLFAATLGGWPSFGPLGWLLCMTLMGAALTYLSLFGDIRDPVRYRWALRSIWSGDFAQALAYTPWWLIGLLATIGSAVAAILRADRIEDVLNVSRFEVFRLFGAPTLAQLQISLVLLLLFMLRDILFVIWLSAGPKRHRADVTGLVSLVLAYVPLAGILWSIGGVGLMPLVLPVAVSANPLDLAPVLIEVAIIGALLYVRWQAATRLGKKY